MRISDWSSDVCSSDLVQRLVHRIDKTPVVFRILGADLFHRRAGAVQIAPEFKNCAVVEQQRGDALGMIVFEAVFGQQLQFVVAHQRVALNQRMTRSEEHTSELQSLMRISYAVFCLKKKTS